MSDDALKPATPLTSYVINVDEAWHVPPPKQTGFKSSRLCCSRLPSTDGLSALTIHDNQPAKEGHCRWGGKCLSVWLIAPLVSGVAGWMRCPAARRRHFDVKTVRCDFLDNNCDNKHVVSVVNFLKCVATKVVLFLIVILKTLTFHKVTHFSCGEIYSNSFIANCLLILTVKALWKSVNI